MELDQEEYHVLEIADVSLDEGDLHSDLLRDLFSDDVEVLLDRVKKIMANREQVQTFKKEVSKIDHELKDIFYREIYQKMCDVINEVASGQRALSALLDNNLLDFMFTLERPPSSLSQPLHQSFLNLIKSINNIKDFSNIFKPVIKALKSIDKKDELAKELHLMIHPEKEDGKSEFKISALLADPAETSKFQEDTAYIKVLTYDFLSKVQAIQYRATEEELEEALKVVEKRPFARILEFILKNEKSHPYCRKVKQQILQFSFSVQEGKPKYSFPQSQLHDELKTPQTIEKAISNYDDRILKYLKKDSLIVEGDKLYFKFNFEMLLKIQTTLKIEGGSFDAQYFNEIIVLIKEFKKHLDKKLVPEKEMQQEGKEESTQIYFTFMIYIFTRYFMKYERERQINMQEMVQNFNEAIINELLQLCLEWFNKFEEKQFSQVLAEDLLSIMAHLYYRNQYQFLAAYSTDTSKLMTKIMIKMKHFPCKWKRLRKIKSIIDRWGDTLPEDCQFFPVIVGKFFDAYFDSKVVIKSKNKAIFSPMFPSRAYTRMFGAETTKKVLYVLNDKIKANQVKNRSEKELSEINQILYKMSFLYSARIRLPDNDKVADLLYRLYQHHADSLPLIYNFRTWIIHNANIYKDNSTLKTVNELSQSIMKNFGKLEEAIMAIEVENLLSPTGPIMEDELIKGTFKQFQFLINSMQLKSIKEEYGTFIYNEVVNLIQKMSALMHRLYQKVLSQLQKSKEASQKKLRSLQLCKNKCLYAELEQLYRNLVNVLRFYACNISKLIEAKDQTHFLKAISVFVLNLARKEDISLQSLMLTNQIFGLSEVSSSEKNKSHLEKVQILKASMQRFGVESNEQFTLESQPFVPINTLSVTYSQIRGCYPRIIKNVINQLQNTSRNSPFWQTARFQLPTLMNEITEGQKFKEQIPKKISFEAKTLIRFLVMPSVNIHGPCCFNGKPEQKGKEEQALGILWDQFKEINTSLSSSEVSMLQFEILSFFDMCKSKDKKIIEKQIGAASRPGQYGRDRQHPPRIAEAITQELMQMGISREEAQIALQNIDQPDPELALDWINANSERIQQLVTRKIMERSRSDHQSSQTARKIESSEKTKEIQTIKYNQLQEEIGKQTKKLIKLLVPELFGQYGEKVKNLIFICLDSFKEDYKNKQYDALAGKIYSEIDTLNQEFSLLKLGIIVGSLETIITKKPDIIVQMHEKSITAKLLTFMSKVDQDIGEKLLSVINETLPIPSEKSTDTMKEYLHYIADVLLTSEIKSRHESEILLKMTKAQDKGLNEKILNIVCKGLSKGCLREGLFSILSIVFNSDEKFIMANIQFDIKSFLIQNHDIKKPDTLLEVETKKFAMSFLKYEDTPLLAEVCKKLFVKRKNRNLLYFNKNEHDLFFSEILDSSFLNYDLPETQKIILCSLVNLIVSADKLEEQLDYIRELYKTLQFYKILIPYCLRVKVEGMTFFEWLLQKQFPVGKGNVICFLTFLFVRNGLFLNQNLTLSDYLMSKLVKKYIESDEMRKSRWIKIAILYFLQIKNINNKANRPLSQQVSKSLKEVFESQLDISQPVDYALVSECLYLIYKYEMIEGLSSLYKVSEQGQFTLEKQFINMDLFYTKRKIVDGGSRESSLNRLRPQERRMLFDLDGGFDEGDEEEMDAMMTLRILRNLSRERQVMPTGMHTILSPIQPPPAQQQQQSNEPNEPRENVQEISEEPKEPVKEAQEPKKEQKMQEQVPEAPKQYLNEIIELFQAIFPVFFNAEIHLDNSLPKIPTASLKKEDLGQGKFHVKVKEPRTQLDQKFNKTNIFKERVNEIIEVVEPGCKWVIADEKKDIIDSRIQNLSNVGSGNLRQYVMNRFIIGERERRPEPGTTEINVSSIVGQLAEYQEPKPEVKPEQRQEKEKQEKEEEKPKIEEEKPEEAPQEPQQVQEHPVQIQQAQQGEQPAQEVPIQAEQIQQNQEIQPNQQQIQMQQQPVEVPEQPVVEPQQELEQQHPDPIEQPQQEMQAQIQQNQQQPQEGNGQEPQVMEEAPPHREILSMMGLPMTFLRDAGIDEELFDSLPEDMQIEQLNHIVQEQRRNAVNNGGNGGNGGEGQGNPVTDLQSENVAFIASLDPQLRAQTLMEATPEFLMTLPPEMRAEAENHRQRMIGRIIENEQYEEEEEYMERQRAKKNLIYPEVSEKNFPDINANAAKQISKSMLMRIPKFKVEGIKILLQNKKTQKMAISTLISYVKNIRDVVLTNCSYNKDKKEWSYDEMAPEGGSRKMFIEEILDVISDHLAYCPYKDEKFLCDKYPYENYFAKNIEVNKDLEADHEGYYPLYQLLEMSIDNHHTTLSAELIKKVKHLPAPLCRKMMKGIRDEKFNDDFYRGMSGLSDDEQVKKIFLEEFPEEKPPKYATLTKILQYNFSRVPYLKKLHAEALANYKNGAADLNDFLNEIFRAYDLEDLQAIESILVENKKTHFQIIKYLYSKGKVLDGEPLGIILKLPHLLDFETKRFIFQNNPKLNRTRGRFVIEVNRTNLFHESYNQIMNRTAREMQGRVKVVFVDEPAEDAGGVKKQWFLCLSRQIFDASYALFEPSSSGNTYQPNPKSYINAEHLNYFKFIGRFVGKALSEGMLIDAFFSRAFYKMILGQDLELKDLEQQDYNFYTSMCWLRDNKLAGDQYTFSYLYDYFGKMITKELIPDGEKTFVTEENKQEYIQKYSLAIMRDSIGPQIEKFLEGFYEMLPKQYISFFEAKELQLLMSGLPTINLDDLKQNVDYVGFNPTDDQIKWFWEILDEYTNEDLARLVQFITGTSKIPLQGFVALQGMNGLQKISIHKDSHVSQLPKSHTCFNQLDLPCYPTKELMKQNLRVVLTWGSEGFGFM